MKKILRKISPKIGDVFEVPLADGARGYGQVVSSVYLGFFAVKSDAPLALDAILKNEVAFRIVVTLDALQDGRWRIVGHAHRTEAMSVPIRTWRQPAGGPLCLVEWKPETGTLVRSASQSEVRGLEKDGIWLPAAAVIRLERVLRGEIPNNLEIA